MNDVDLTEAAELLNDYLEEQSTNNVVKKPYTEGSYYLERDGKSSIGRGGAQALLEGMGAIVIKTLYMEDEDLVRIWLKQITKEEVEVTRTVERFTFDEL